MTGNQLLFGLKPNGVRPALGLPVLNPEFVRTSGNGFMDHASCVGRDRMEGTVVVMVFHEWTRRR